MNEHQNDSDESRMGMRPGEDASVAGELAALRVVQDRDRAQIAALQQALESSSDEAGRAQWQLVEVRRRLEQAQARAAELEGSTSFQLGQLVASALKSPRKMASLPLRMVSLLRRSKTTPAPGVEAVPSAVAAPVIAAAQASAPAVAAGRASARGLLPDMPSSLAELRVAAVMDDFTRACFAPVCQLTTLRADSYESQLIDARPHLLLVESAWRGDGDSWRHMVAQRSGELLGLLDMCRRRGIPTVFWNKEDPAHFETFLPTAALFDHVFTTDVDSIRRYVDALGHARVHLLPFACQPSLHHPLVKAPRKDGFAFAGSYYHRYPERCVDFERIVTTLQPHGDVVIFDRNSERADPAFEFPPRYASMLRPALPYERIDEAYKGYRFAININTIKQSQTMFARRVFELMASNTLVVSNYSRGMRNLFGDLVIATDDVTQLEQRINALAHSSQEARGQRLLALRKVLGEHTYHHRMQTVVTALAGRPLPMPSTPVAMIGAVRSRAELESLLATFDRQLYAARKLVVVVAEGSDVGLIPVRSGIMAMGSSEAAQTGLSSSWPGHYFARIDVSDYYGPHYLSDLMSARWFADGCVVGKSAHYEVTETGLRLNEGERYREGVELSLRSSIVPAAALGGAHVADLFSTQDHRGVAPSACTVALDEFSYCRNGMGKEVGPVDVPDALDMGIPLAELMAWTERLATLPGRVIRSRRPDSNEVNDRPADPAAWPARQATLFVAQELAGLEQLAGSSAGDRFVLCSQPARSFGEDRMGQVMYGDTDDLSDLLGTGYEEVIVLAPDAGCCEVLRRFSAHVNVGVASDGHTQACGQGDRPAWQALLAEARPRVRRFEQVPGRQGAAGKRIAAGGPDNADRPSSGVAP